MAYAAVISLKNTIERTINPTNPQITKSAYEEVKKSLEGILKRLNTSRNRSNRSMISSLDDQIREAACKLEDFMIESYGLRHSLPPSDSLGDEGNYPRIPHGDEEIVKHEICSFSEKVMKLEKKYISKSTMVGLSDQIKKIREELLDRKLDLKTVSLFGMTGIGKSSLAREIYLPLTIENFRVQVWATLGPRYEKTDVLEDIAAQIKCQLKDQYKKHDNVSLGEDIYKNLCGRRYIIVLDDIWSKDAWHDLKLWFPAENNGSRILLTTRLEEVAEYPTKPSVHLQIRLLNSEESWNLLCQNVFGEDEVCPPQLEKDGRKIVERCEGLPLLILEVADLLNRADKTEEYWKEAARRESKIFADAYDRISEVLLLSFNYLPHYLKACFLYMGAFPNNHEIPLPKLINLWTVEDFLEPNETQTLQDFAMVCLEKLVSQSLVFVRKDSSGNRVKSCKLHSTYWHLCVIEARKSKFLHVLNCFTDGFNEYMEGQPRLSIQNNVLFGIKEVYNSMATTSRARSLLCTGEYHQYPVPICLDLMVLLEVLDALAVRFYEFPNEVLKLLQLKYLALTHNGNLPSLISKLQSLQSLIVSQHHNIKLLGESACLPKEIWDMQELRHLRIMGNNLPDPSGEAKLPNLLTLHVKGHSCTKDVFNSIPKLKKLGIKIELQPRSNEIIHCFEHISILSELESLKCVVVNPRLRSQAVAPPNPNSGFPKGLKKMSLNGIGYSWKYMTAIGSLPELQVLKLRRSAFRGPIWETKAEEFPALEFLLLEDIDLQQWEIDDDDDEGCFPNLKRLIIRHCYKLEMIPSQIGNIPTLEAIEVVDCMRSVVASAKGIQDDEKENGNNYFQAPISLSWNRQ
ncbi:hypothetical protein C2S51_003085 [Perilla frutescens var. frutescens]|nr:hypothetical protein C2S51_003085 [Perilla frutescens var. frutescens]